MCDFEACCKKSDSKICQCEFVSNIKPEIGKVRPVIVIKPHRRHRLAIVIPFTTKEPEHEVIFTLEIPVGIMPGKLKHKKCWALCDMIQVVNLARLQRVYRQGLSDINLPSEYFQQIIAKIHKLIG